MIGMPTLLSFMRFHWKRLTLGASLGGLAACLAVGLTWNPYSDHALIHLANTDLTAVEVAHMAGHSTAIGTGVVDIGARAVTPALATEAVNQKLMRLEKQIPRGVTQTAPTPNDNAAWTELMATKQRLVQTAITLAQIRKLATEPDGMEKAAQLASGSEMVARALQSLGEARVDASVANARYGHAHPKWLAATARLQGAEAEVNRAVRLYADALAAEKTSLEDAIANWTGAITQDKPDTAPAAFTVLTPAGTPSGPDMGWPILLVLSGLAIGFVAGAGSAVYDDFKRGQVRNLGRLRRQFDLPVLTGMPCAETAMGHELEALHHKSNQVLAETVRGLFAALRLKTLQGEAARVVLMASPARGDGKSTLTLWLAQTAKQSGLRVAVVDCDLRRPSLHKLFGIGNAKGLTDYLTGMTGLDRIVYDRHDSGVDIVTARPAPQNAIGLVSSARMSLLVGELRERYDLVLIDTPSCMGISDAALIAPLCDQVVMLASAENTAFAHLGAALLPFQYRAGPQLNLAVTHMRMHQLSENAGLLGAATYADAA